jgi:hypothetical protein
MTVFDFSDEEENIEIPYLAVEPNSTPMPVNEPPSTLSLEIQKILREELQKSLIAVSQEISFSMLRPSIDRINRQTCFS